MAKEEQSGALYPADGFPRVLVIDITRRGDGSATGALKETLFTGWPVGKYLQVHATGGVGIGLFGAPDITERCIGLVDDRQALELVQAYRPQLVLYRPVPDLAHFHMMAMGLVRRLAVPLAVWIMDDWPMALDLTRPTLAAAFDHDLRDLLDRAALRLAIGDAMATAFAKRYGKPFLSFGNGVDLTDWPPPSTAAVGPAFTLRYSGSLAADMTLSALLGLARSVQALADGGTPCRLEINTRQFWLDRAGGVFAGLTATTLTAVDRDGAAYRQWLADAGAVVIAYNVDAASQTYCRYSVANKLPELLASGAPILAAGPRGNATIDLVDMAGAGLVVNVGNVGALAQELADFIASPTRRRDLADAARVLAATQFDIGPIRADFTRVLRDTAIPTALPHMVLTDTYPREAQARLDETALVALLTDAWGPRDSRVMLDVGAHFGSSSQYFVDRGWRCFCFEPDTANREKLAARFRNEGRVSIHPVAVGETAMAAAAFFTSDESTGISSLLPFRDSHEQADYVPVTTLDLFTREQGIDHVDFLKIDAEGWDLMVLRGIPWDRLRPTVIECEFEDAKTRRMGYGMTDLADYLVARGYTVLVSEWHPVIRYGIEHQWCRMALYPTAMRDPASWGNLLAFQAPLDPITLNGAIDHCLFVANPAATIPTRRHPSPVHIISTAVELLSLPTDRPVWIYGASTGGQLIHAALERQGRLQVAGFLDSYREGWCCGLPVQRYTPDMDLNGALVIVASQYAREIIPALRAGRVCSIHDASPLVLDQVASGASRT